MLLFNIKYTILGGLITILSIFSLWQSQNLAFGTFIWLLYVIFFGYYLGQFFLPKEKRVWQILYGLFALLSVFLLISTGIYWFFGVSYKIFTIILIVLPILVSLQKEPNTDIFGNLETEIDLESYTYIKSHLFVKLLAVLVVWGQCLILFTLFTKSYGDTLISPWTLTGPKLFWFFAFLTCVLFWILQKSRHTPSNILLLVGHGLVSLSVLIIIFKYGFGFDPIIHEATANWIADKGFILPKQPYYIGQYMLVIFNSFITHWSIADWNQAMVTLLASITIPFVLYFSLFKREWKYKIFPAILLVFFYPLSFFTATTPNNLAILLSLVLASWMWYEFFNGNIKTHLFGILLTLGICTIHPFIGLPLFAIYTGFLLFFYSQKLRTKIWQIPALAINLILTTLIVPLAFYFNALRLGQKLSVKNPIENLVNFWQIFARPYWIWIDKSTWDWQALYHYRDAIKPIFVFVIILGIIIAWKKYKTPMAKFFLTSTIGLVFSSFILATTINYPDVISYEQKAYAMRSLELAMVILLPFFVIAMRELFIKLKGKTFLQFLVSVACAVLLLISWYFTYPTRDPISYYTGYNVRSADITAVKFIEEMNKNEKYLVLTNQTVSSAALKTVGFARYLNTSAGEQYFYSIPTGGTLYQYFRKMVYEEPKRQWMLEAMKFANVKKAYFIHTNYWAPAAEIRDKAKLEADRWWELVGGRVWVYEYVVKD